MTNAGPQLRAVASDDLPRGSHPRCAEWARQVDLAPAGTAPQTDVFVLVEHPLPWPRDVGADPLLADIERAARDQAGGRSVRVQAVATDRSNATRRVVVFVSGGRSFAGYGRLEDAVPPERLVETAARLVAAEVPEPVRDRVTDVLICTHGARDACCGSLGTRLWRDLELAGARVHRTSHTGGHRFAPTAITFPDGNYWAFLDQDVLAGIVDRSLPVEVASSHLRGCAAFAPSIQVADGAALEAHGWSWLACVRSGEEQGTNVVRMGYEACGGERGAYAVQVEAGRAMPVPECGADPATAAKVQSEWRVRGTEVAD